MKRGIYLIWDLPLADTVSPEEFFVALQGDYPCAVQLRAKHSRTKPPVFESLKSACRARKIMFVVNDRVDWLDPDVDGLHLGQTDGEAPTDPSLFVGRSTHQLEQVRDAARDDRISLLGFGPIRTTQSKRNPLPPRGFELLVQAVAQAQHKPVVAIGGLTADDLKSVHHAGAHAAAVIGAVWASPDPVEALRSLVRCWNNL